MGTVIYTLHSSKVRGFKWQKLKACSFLLLFLTYHIDAQPVFKVIKGFYQNIKQQEDALLLHCQHRCILLHPSLLLTATADDYKTATPCTPKGQIHVPDTQLLQPNPKQKFPGTEIINLMLVKI